MASIAQFVALAANTAASLGIIRQLRAGKICSAVTDVEHFDFHCEQWCSANRNGKGDLMSL